jgi:hypothetical protein
MISRILIHIPHSHGPCNQISHSIDFRPSWRCHSHTNSLVRHPLTRSIRGERNRQKGLLKDGSLYASQLIIVTLDWAHGNPNICVIIPKKSRSRNGSQPIALYCLLNDSNSSAQHKLLLKQDTGVSRSSRSLFWPCIADVIFQV